MENNNNKIKNNLKKIIIFDFDGTIFKSLMPNRSLYTSKVYAKLLEKIENVIYKIINYIIIYERKV